VLNDWEYEPPAVTVAVPAGNDLPLWMTSTIHVPARNRWNPTPKPFDFEIPGTEM